MKVGNIDFDEKLRSQTNTLILGPPGFGKSKLMEQMMRQDFAKGQPFCFIDFHGPGFEAVKRSCAYSAYSSRKVIILDPSEGRFVKPYRPFCRIEGVELGTQTSSMVEATMSIWGDSNYNAYPVMFKILKVFYSIVVEKDIPLTEAFHLLGKRDDLNRVVETLSDPYIKTVWQDLRKLPHFEWSRQITPTLNRLFRIVQSKAVQRFMCAFKEGTLELTFKDTILVNLGTSGNLDSEAAKMFCVLLVNNFYQKSKWRKGKNGKPPSPYYLYIDEWVIPSPDYSRILAECRKFGLLMCLANQDLSQIRTAFGSGFADTLLTLCQAQICFGGLNDADATRLAKEWEVEKEKVKGLAERKCFVKLPRQPARVSSMPEVGKSYVTDKEITRYEKRMAKKTEAFPVEEVDARLNRTHTETKPQEPLSRRDFIR